MKGITNSRPPRTGRDHRRASDAIQAGRGEYLRISRSVVVDGPLAAACPRRRVGPTGSCRALRASPAPCSRKAEAPVAVTIYDEGAGSASPAPFQLPRHSSRLGFPGRPDLAHQVGPGEGHRPAPNPTASLTGGHDVLEGLDRCRANSAGCADPGVQHFVAGSRAGSMMKRRGPSRPRPRRTRRRSCRSAAAIGQHRERHAAVHHLAQLLLLPDLCGRSGCRCSTSSASNAWRR